GGGGLELRAVGAVADVEVGVGGQRGHQLGEHLLGGDDAVAAVGELVEHRAGGVEDQLDVAGAGGRRALGQGRRRGGQQQDQKRGQQRREHEGPDGTEHALPRLARARGALGVCWGQRVRIYPVGRAKEV